MPTSAAKDSTDANASPSVSGLMMDATKLSPHLRRFLALTLSLHSALRERWCEYLGICTLEIKTLHWIFTVEGTQTISKL